VPTLVEKLTVPEKRKHVISDCVALVDDEVKRKGGLSGAAIKLAFATVKAVKPGFLEEAVDHLLDDFARRLEPFYQSHAQAGGQTLPAYFAAKSGEVADALLGITDERSARAKNQTVKKAYEKLRPSAKKHVEEAAPGIGKLVEKHTST
jgi:hypothetical protein